MVEILQVNLNKFINLERAPMEFEEEKVNREDRTRLPIHDIKLNIDQIDELKNEIFPSRHNNYSKFSYFYVT